jgi:very-short-patch-repair endonuclease
MKNSGSDALAPVLARDRARALRTRQTEVERILWQRLRNRQINGTKLRRQHPIGPYVADFCCVDALLVIELDGSQHGEEPDRQADQHRTEYLERVGYRVLRFWNEEVLDNIDGVLETIAKFL